MNHVPEENLQLKDTTKSQVKDSIRKGDKKERNNKSTWNKETYYENKGNEVVSYYIFVLSIYFISMVFSPQVTNLRWNA